MPKINMDQLLQAVNDIMENQDSNSEEAKVEAKVEAKPEAQPSNKETQEEAQKAQEEFRKAQEEANRAAEEKERELEEKAAAQEKRIIDSKLESGFSEYGFDKETSSGILSHLDYATLKNDNGEADDEKIQSFVDAVSSIALRKPPKGKASKKLSDTGGMAKYLDIEI